MSGAALPLAEVASWRGGGSPLGCLVASNNASDGIKVVPNSGDQIDALGVGVNFTSAGPTETWKFTALTAGHWTSLRVT